MTASDPTSNQPTSTSQPTSTGQPAPSGHRPSSALPERPVIAIVGAGAIGAYYGSRLAQPGHDVHFLLRSDYAHVRDHGWTIRSCDGDFSLPAAALRVYDRPAAMPVADLVIITLKSTANDQ